MVAFDFFINYHVSVVEQDSKSLIKLLHNKKFINWVVAMRLDGRRFFGVPRLAPHLSSIPRQLFGEKQAADCSAKILVPPWLAGLARAQQKKQCIFISSHMFLSSW